MCQQHLQLKREYNTLNASFKSNEYLHWIGSIQPLPCSPEYMVQINYQSDKYPETKVLSPKLEKGDKERLPHVYSKDGLCLFMPKYREWKPIMSIARTIVPWTSLWLFYYEIWKATGEWRGGGIHPGNSRVQPRPDRSFNG